MRPDFDWSMSTAGLTAQETYLPTESPYLRASYCHSMARSKPSWSNPHQIDQLLYFSMDSKYTEPSFSSYQPLPPTTLSVEKKKHSPCTQRLPQKKSRPTLLSLSSGTEPTTPSPVADDDQVVPCFQRLSVQERCSPPQTPGRCSKPLPPLPTRTQDPCPELDMDKEVEEFFTGEEEESRRLVPDPCPKPHSSSSSSSSCFRYGAPFRRSFRDGGKINHAYFEGPTVQPRPPRESNREPLEKWPPSEPPEPPSAPGSSWQQDKDRAMRRLKRSQSGPAGSKPSLLRSSCRIRRPTAAATADSRTMVPPPIPPRPSKPVDYRRWSAGDPPALPPREPLATGGGVCCCRTPSPKGVPTYVNGVMPTTQSFAPDPKYVSLQRQHSEGSPCILPVIENGRQASNTHYFLMPPMAAGGKGDSN